MSFEKMEPQQGLHPFTYGDYPWKFGYTKTEYLIYQDLVCNFYPYQNEK